METSQLPDNPPGLLFIVPELADSSDEQHGSIIQVKEEPIEETTVEPMEHSHVAVQDEGTESYSNLTVKEESLDDTSVNIDDPVKDECLDDTSAEETSGGQYGNHGNIQSMDEGNHHGSSFDQVSIKEESGDECHQAEFTNSSLDDRTSELQNNQSADIEAGYLKLEVDESEALDPSPGTSSTGQTGNAASLTFDSYGNLVHRPESLTDEFEILRRIYEDMNHKSKRTEHSSNTTTAIQSATGNDRWSTEHSAHTGHTHQDGEVKIKSEPNLFEHHYHQGDHLATQPHEEKFTLPTHSESDAGYICPECQICFSQIENLEMHMMMAHTGQQSYDCKVCGKAFSLYSKLKSHMKMMQLRFSKSDKSYRCVECGMCSYSKSEWINHMITHDGDLINQMFVHGAAQKPYGCVLCSKKFHSTPTLKKHLMQHQCMVCGKLARSLKIHMKSHKVDKPHKCAKCGKCFQFSSNLNSHMKTHYGETPHLCNVCGKNFRCAEYLKEHMAVHSEETSYVCETCGKKYSSQTSLDIHMNDHLAIKPHICEVCGKGFGIHFSLTKHMKVHTGGKTHTCNVCGKTFLLAEYLRNHKFEHLGEEQPECDKCGKKFARKHSLARHMEIHQQRIILTDDREMSRRRYENTRHRLMRTLPSSSSTRATQPGTEPSPLVQEHAVKSLDTEHNNKETELSADKGDQMSQEEKLILETVLNEQSATKPYVCEECGKGFYGHKVLKSHMKNYICNVCGKYLCSAKILKKHLIEHSGENPQECEPILAKNFLAYYVKKPNNKPP